MRVKRFEYLQWVIICGRRSKSRYVRSLSIWTIIEASVFQNVYVCLSPPVESISTVYSVPIARKRSSTSTIAGDFMGSGPLSVRLSMQQESSRKPPQH